MLEIWRKEGEIDANDGQAVLLHRLRNTFSPRLRGMVVVLQSPRSPNISPTSTVDQAPSRPRPMLRNYPVTARTRESPGFNTPAGACQITTPKGEISRDRTRLRPDSAGYGKLAAQHDTARLSLGQNTAQQTLPTLDLMCVVNGPQKLESPS